jgi:hypothetical protein
VELANKKRGHLHVFEGMMGLSRLCQIHPKYLTDALAKAAKGDAKLLRDVFADHGFLPDAAALLAELVTKRGRGRPSIATPEQLYEERLEQIKKELRRNGVTGRVLQKAMKILEAEHQSCRDWAERTGTVLPGVDFEKLANRFRQRP